jgi:hypothetical protein
MGPLPATVTDAELIALIDRWAVWLEREDYEAAFAFTGHIPETGWTPSLIREVIKGYGGARPGQRVTVDGVATDVSQRKPVER